MLTRLASQLEVLYHEGPSVTDVDLERMLEKAKEARPSPDEGDLSAVLAEPVDVLLHGDDEAARCVFERATAGPCAIPYARQRSSRRRRATR